MHRQKSPLYEKVRTRVFEWIRTRHSPGDLLPTQKEIASKTGSSLITVKRAILELSREGLVRAIPGKGTIVQKPVVTDLHSGVSSWTDSVSGLGRTPGTAWTKMDVRIPPRRIANLLEIPSGGRTLRVRRLRTSGGEPICLMTNEVSSARFPDLEKTGLRGESFYATLRMQYGVFPMEAVEEVGCRSSTSAERRSLGCDVNQVLEVSRRSLDARGRPLEIATVIARPDRYRYQVKLFNNPQ